MTMLSKTSWKNGKKNSPNLQGSKRQQRKFWNFGVVSLFGNGCLSHTSEGTAKGTSFFIFFSWSYDVWTTFWPLQKFKTSRGLSSRVFILDRGRLGAAIQDGSTKNFETRCFGHLTSNEALKFCFLTVILFCAGESSRGLKKHSFWHGMNLCCGVDMGFLRG